MKEKQAEPQPHESIEEQIVNEIQSACTCRTDPTDMDIAYGICIRIVQKHFKAAAAKDGQASTKDAETFYEYHSGDGLSVPEIMVAFCRKKSNQDGQAERMFSQSQAEEIWDESGKYHSIDGFYKDSPDKQQYFKEKFNIDL